MENIMEIRNTKKNDPDFPDTKNAHNRAFFCYEKNLFLISSTGISLPVQILKASAPW